MSAQTAQFSAKELLSDLYKKFPSSMAVAVNVHVQQRAEEWVLRTQLELSAENPFDLHELHWKTWSTKFEQGTDLVDEYLAATACYGDLCQVTGQPFDPAFWNKYVSREKAQPNRGEERLSNDSPSKLLTAAGLLSIKWREEIDRARSEWELKEIARRRDALREELEALLVLMQTLADQLEDLGLEPGILLDLSKGRLTSQDIEQFKRWAQYLASDAGVKALCDVLGKLRQIELSERVEQVMAVHTQEVWQPDPNSREEITGVRLGRDLEHALPSELALLADPETSILFDMKYIESRLMCFDMRGMQQVGEQHERLVQQSVSEMDKLGPMVICLDTSGSMQGMPEIIAKAVALYMATKAYGQKRACYLINFSTDIETSDLSLAGGMESLIRFLQMSFHGGTDIAPALKHAVETMRCEEYTKADLLVISDFVMGSLPQSIHAAIEEQRINGNRFHSLVIDSSFHAQGMATLFDQEWIYDPNRSRITELVDFQRCVIATSTTDGSQ